MDIYDYLKWDHKQVAHLFKQFAKTENVVRRKQIVAMILDELEMHAHSEQATFYKALEQHAESKDLALHGEKEHREIEAQINLLKNAQQFDQDWVRQVEKLQEIVEHHVHEEEHQVFKAAKKVLTEYKAYCLKEEMHYLKQEMIHAAEKEQAINPA